VSSPVPPPRLALVVGEEELLVARTVQDIVRTVRATDPAGDIREVAGATLCVGDVYDLLSPSLFGERRVVTVTGAHEINADTATALIGCLAEPAEAITLVLVHPGGARGKAILTAMRDAGATEITCAKLTRAEERLEFIRGEVTRAGGAITAPAATAILDAVGTDLRELAAVSSQLVSDSGGRVDVEAVNRYHRGRAEVTGFAVADRAVVGDVVGALATLRSALQVGVAHVLVADALADGVRTIARVTGSGRANPYQLASTLGLPPWKVKRAQGQSRGWTERGLTWALRVVADANADVKGVAADPSYALEQAVRRLGAARALR